MAKAYKIKSIWMIFLLGLLGLILLVVLGVNPLVKNFLALRVKDKLVGNFYYSYDNLRVDLVSRSVILENINWKFPKDTTVFNHEGHISRLKITGVSLVSIIQGNHIRIHEIQLDSLEMITGIETPEKKDSLPNGRMEIDQESFNFYDLIKGQMKSLKVGKIEITNGTATWLNPETKKIWRKIDNVQFEIYSIALDSAIASANNGWFTMQDAALEGSNGELFLEDSLHKLQLKKFQIDYGKESITIDSLVVIPLFTKNEMPDVEHYETDRLEIMTSNIIARGVDFKKLLVENKLRIESIIVDNLNLDAFRDKNAPIPYNLYVGMPQIWLKYLNLNLKIDSMKITNGNIHYEELSDRTQKMGVLFFSELSANLYNLTNDSLCYQLNPLARLNVSAKLMGKSRLNADFTFNLLSTNGDHWFKGSLDSFDLRDLNPVFIPLSAISIRNGHINKMNFDIRLNNDVSDGKITFLYSNLKIDKLDEDNLNNSDFDNTIKSLLANTFLLKKSNPSGNSDPRVGIIHFNRSKNKSILNFWLKSVLSGMKSTVLSTEENN